MSRMRRLRFTAGPAVFISVPEIRARLFEAAADSYGRDAKRAARCLIDLDTHSRQRSLAGRRLETAGRNFGEEAADGFFLVHAEHAVVIAAHADIADVSSAAREHAVVGGRRMR